MGLNPQGYGAVVNTQMTADPTQVHAIKIHLHGLLADCLRIAMSFRFRRVLAATEHAAIPLGTGLGLTGLVLAFRLPTSRTYMHNPILAHSDSHSRLPKMRRVD